MTPREIDSRLTMLETRIAPEEAPRILVKFISTIGSFDGWQHDEARYWRSPGESDNDLFDRVVASINPPPGEIVKLRQVSY
jgi:hypothetical protein